MSPGETSGILTQQGSLNRVDVYCSFCQWKVSVRRKSKLKVREQLK